MRRLSALDALGRGVANLRGNLEVIAVSVGGTIGVATIVILSLLPWFSVLGIDPSWFVGGRPEAVDLEGWFDLLTSPMRLLSTLGWGLVSLLIGLTVASFGFAWYFGGILGVLVAGDAQAPAGAGREAVLFRTWSPRFFTGEARRLLWPVLWFYSIFLGIELLAVALMGAVVVFAALFAGRSGAWVGFTIGCGGMLPAAFILLVAILAMSLGQAELVREPANAMRATRAAFAVLGRRFGASLALFLLLVFASISVAVVQMGVSFMVLLALSESAWAATTFQIALTLIQMLINAAIHFAFAAAFIALYRNERALELENQA